VGGQPTLVQFWRGSSVVYLCSCAPCVIEQAGACGIQQQVGWQTAGTGVRWQERTHVPWGVVAWSIFALASDGFGAAWTHQEMQGLDQPCLAVLAMWCRYMWWVSARHACLACGVTMLASLPCCVVYARNPSFRDAF